MKLCLCELLETSKESGSKRAVTWLQVVWKQFGLPVTLKGHVSKEVRRNWFDMLRDTETTLHQKVTSKFTAVLSIEISSKQKRDLVWSKLAGWMSWTPGRGLTPWGSAALNWGVGIIVRLDIWVDSFVLGDFCLSGLCWCIRGQFFFFILVVSSLRRFVEGGENVFPTVSLSWRATVLLWQKHCSHSCVSKMHQRFCTLSSFVV